MKIMRDLTERHNLQEETELKLSNVSRLATLGETTAAIAHELKQPLAAIVANGDACRRLLDQPSIDQDEIRDTVADMTRGALRAGEIIDRVQALFQRHRPVMRRLNINDVVREAVFMTKTLLQDRHIGLQINLGGKLPNVLGDRIQLEEVVINLLRNAAQAVWDLDDDRRRLSVSSWGQADRVFVAVEDTGERISQEAAKRLFAPFFSTREEGLGLGLRICRSILDAHGGAIYLANHAGPGARFEFRLPAAS